MTLNRAPNQPPDRPIDRDDLNKQFQPQDMVRWFSAGQLVATVAKIWTSSTFGAYTDRREMQAAIDPGGRDFFYDYSDRGELWLDFIADSGDGFDSTYAIAWLASRPTLNVRGARDGSVCLPRADVLVLGGDQVYPTPSVEQYQNRFEGPYRAAFPWTDDPPHMFALAGNHDWYDGLTAFLRLFCQGRWIGGWRTQQRRSYFALKLPHDWWLLGLDMQLSADLDQPQKEYFESIIHNHMLKKGAAPPRVVLCCPDPSWVYSGVGPDQLLIPRTGGSGGGRMLAPDPTEFEKLAYFESRFLAENGIREVVALTGSLHHYARYAARAERDQQSGAITAVTDPNRTQRITAGGGGALLHATHHNPAYIQLCERTPSKSVVDREYALEASFPSPATSRRLSLHALALPYRNPQFAFTLAGLYLLFTWVLQSASKASNTFQARTGWASLLEPDRPAPLWAQFANVGVTLQHSPSGVVLLLALFGGLAGLAYWQRPGWAMVMWGMLHAAAHATLAIALMWLVAPLVTSAGGGSIDSGRAVFAFVLASLLAGGLLGAYVLVAYLLLSSILFAAHDDEVFGVSTIKHYKNFLRLHVGPELTIYPIGVPHVPSWTVPSNTRQLPPEDPWLVPVGDPPAPILIEPPIVLR